MRTVTQLQDLHNRIDRFLRNKFGGSSAIKYFNRWDDETDPSLWYFYPPGFPKYQEVLKEKLKLFKDDVSYDVLKYVKIALDVYFMEIIRAEFPELSEDKIIVSHDDKDCFPLVKNERTDSSIKYGYMTWISPEKRKETISP